MGAAILGIIGMPNVVRTSMTDKALKKTKIVIDLDGTLTIHESHMEYSQKLPNIEVIARLREFSALGYYIVVQTARNMRTYNGEIGLINVHTLPVIIDWLNRHSVPFDEIIVGKPWCGDQGFYVDDRTIRPDEFVRLTLDEILDLLGRSAAQ
jgi:capsule biosynthesis phosphatase